MINNKALESIGCDELFNDLIQPADEGILEKMIKNKKLSRNKEEDKIIDENVKIESNSKLRRCIDPSEEERFTGPNGMKEPSDINSIFRVSSKPTTNPNDPVSHKAVHLDFYNKDDHIGQVFISAVDTNNSFIYNLVVFKKYRGQGYGRQIMKYVLSHYNARELTVTDDNMVAIALYKSMGFKLKKTFNDPITHKKMLWMRCSGPNDK